MIFPTRVTTGDTILIVSPAKAIEKERIVAAKAFLEQAGFCVEIAPHASGQLNYFSGSVEERAADMQWAIDHPTAKAIWCARGGYGCIQLMDYLQWANFLRQPKWLIGFSDVTVFHHYLSKMDIASLHATMPLDLASNSPESKSSLLAALKGEEVSYTYASTVYCRKGSAVGRLIGGNLSIIYSLLGTDLTYDFSETILFIEDIGEALYAIDRMMYSLKRKGVFQQIKGLVVGGMTQLRDSEPGYGKSVEQLISAHLEFTSFPVTFNFPTGHQADNRAMCIGQKVQLIVNRTTSSLEFVMD